ncbi:hypothetical protein [Parabacteroides sp. HGS0025]|uniref:hypothetical protein n=1 Tax=Parabacteroides sp. HGS0025 TaxID=1078087 RepID=UPI0006175EAF|nr:hypothetical protein [Parabacteroides sp. HGS0025]
MYKIIKELLGEKPSGRKFRKKTERMAPEERAFYVKAVYDAAFCDWVEMTDEYRTFVLIFVCSDWARSADYLRTHTVLGKLAFPLREPLMLRRLLTLLETYEKDFDFNSMHLAFICFLAFGFDGNLQYFSCKLRNDRADRDDIEDLENMRKWAEKRK